MKKLSHLTIVFIAFVFGQGIQLFTSAVAYNLYANRPVMWNAIAAGISIIMVVLAYVLIRMESESGGAHTAQTFVPEVPKQRKVKHFGAIPPLETDPEPIEFDKV